MSENLKKFLEFVGNNPELLEKAKQLKADDPEKAKEIAITFAKENGFELTEADFAASEGEMSENELADISGGDCICALAGGGGGTDKYDGKTYGCACVGYGQGGDGRADDFNCCCVLEGGGVDGHMLDGDGFSFM